MMPVFDWYRMLYAIVMIAAGFYAVGFAVVLAAYLAHLNGW
jgi:hypothetical protein